MPTGGGPRAYEQEGSMLRPLLPFRAKPSKSVVQPKPYFAGVRLDPDNKAFLVTIKAPRKPVKFARPRISGRLRILGRKAPG